METNVTESKYKSTGHIVYACQYHIVWCPKYRRKVLTDGIDTRLKELILETAEADGCSVIEMEVMPDHVRLLISVPPQVGVHREVKHLKGRTSHELRKEFPKLNSRLPTLWTNSYFVSTVGGAPLESAKKYIEGQKGV